METVKVTKDLMKERERISEVMANWKMNMRSSSAELRDIAVRLGQFIGSSKINELASEIHKIADNLYNTTL